MRFAVGRRFFLDRPEPFLYYYLGFDKKRLPFCGTGLSVPANPGKVGFHPEQSRLARCTEWPICRREGGAQSRFLAEPINI